MIRRRNGSVTPPVPSLELALNGVGLFEVGVGRVEQQRLPAAQLVIEQLLEARVPSLGHARRDVDALAFLGVVVDIEVLGLQHLKVELLVLDLVPAEVLRRCRRGRQQRGDDGAVR